jgi:hypothetical protein
MKIEIAQNGIQRITLIPETEYEKVFLRDFGKAKGTQITLVDKPTPVMHGTISEGLLVETIKNEIVINNP